MEGYGSDLDFNNCLSLFSNGLNKKAVENFKSWCYAKKFPFQQGFINARRFPIPGLNRTQQQELIDFNQKIDGIKNEIAGMKVIDKLQHLVQIPQLATRVDTEPLSKEAFKN